MTINERRGVKTVNGRDPVVKYIVWDYECTGCGARECINRRLEGRDIYVQPPTPTHPPKWVTNNALGGTYCVKCQETEVYQEFMAAYEVWKSMRDATVAKAWAEYENAAATFDQEYPRPDLHAGFNLPEDKQWAWAAEQPHD